MTVTAIRVLQDRKMCDLIRSDIFIYFLSQTIKSRSLSGSFYCDLLIPCCSTHYHPAEAVAVVCALSRDCEAHREKAFVRHRGEGGMILWH